MYYIVYFFSQLLLPLCFGLGILMDRPFQLVSESVVLLFLTALTVFLTVKLYRGESSMWFLAGPLVSLINGLSLLLFPGGWSGILAAMAAIICGWVLFFRSSGRIAKTICQVLYVLLTICFALLLPLFLFAAVMGHTTVHQKIHSPNGSYTARLIEVDAGATGGDTLVKVRDNDETISLVFGSFAREFTLYSGDWGEHQDMELSWRDENTLLINGVPYQADAAALGSRRSVLDVLEISMPKVRVVYHSDTHGGFHGDGTTVLILSGQAHIPESRFWHDLPMGKNVRDTLEANLPEGLPPVAEGQWFCLDRHSKAVDPADPAMLFGHGSYNFTVALYDSDNQLLYYIKLDT